MTDQPSEAYSQASEALTLDLSGSDSAPHGSASATSSASKSSPSIGPASPATTTCENLARALPVWTYWPGDSRASQSATQGSGSHKQTSDGYGPRLRDSFAYFDHERSCWRTSQHCLDVGLTTSSVTWPRAGMTRNGSAYALPTLVPRTAGKGCSLWPTPTARDHKDTGPNVNYAKLASKSKLAGAVMTRPRLWPTPQASDYKNRGNLSSGSVRRRMEKRKQLNLSMVVSDTSGSLNPTWVEWLMGFPAGWTDLEASATQ